MEYYSDSLPIDQMSEPKIDELLSYGWYRMSDRFFTTSFIRFEKTIYNAIWLRVNLMEFEMSKSLNELKKRNSRFHLEHQKFTIDPEVEALFAKYRSVTTFDTMPTLHEHLYQRKAFDKFSYCIKIYDGEMLIACGIYEKGLTTMEGLVSFYDDNYKKYSLGKYLILSKIEYAQSLGFDYFYLGYYVPGYPKFDYKLQFSKKATEYYYPMVKAWFPLLSYDSYYDEARLIQSKTDCLAQFFTRSKIKFKLVKNAFFDMNIYHDFGGAMPNLVPYFIQVGFDSLQNYDADVITIAYYDSRSDQYMIAECDLYGFVPSYEQLDDSFCSNYVLTIRGNVPLKIEFHDD